MPPTRESHVRLDFTGKDLWSNTIFATCHVFCGESWMGERKHDMACAQCLRSTWWMSSHFKIKQIIVRAWCWDVTDDPWRWRRCCCLFGEERRRRRKKRRRRRRKRRRRRRKTRRKRRVFSFRGSWGECQCQNRSSGRKASQSPS